MPRPRQTQEQQTRQRKAKLALTFITLGGLLFVWAIIWLLYLTVPAEIPKLVYVAAGLLFSGVGALVIGLRLSQIAKQANQDEDQPAASPH